MSHGETFHFNSISISTLLSIGMTFPLLFLVLVLHFLLPFPINVFSTISVCYVVVNMKIHLSHNIHPR